eukprot:gene22221-8771_t
MPAPKCGPHSREKKQPPTPGNPRTPVRRTINVFQFPSSRRYIGATL